MSKDYQSTSKKDSRQIAAFLAANAQAVLPMGDLIEESMMAIDELVETLGRATIEAVLLISAGNVAGERCQGVKSESKVGWTMSSSSSMKQERPISRMWSIATSRL